MTHALDAHSRDVTDWRSTAIVKSLIRFVVHPFEKCLTMCIGSAVLDVPFLGAAGLIGVDDPIHQQPELTALVVAFTCRHQWPLDARAAPQVALYP